ncbi:2Fe-2S iron-sulfur cluster-binding protein [Marinobacterium jannaschii]|uniref:2Fe-2S iron-sulfur cluster-binding protein n=1 Tax=Marinobacterium jannaschii TaxID=64970 RepID=UPI0004825F04|nr:2Fe-2S iron-sulfur cluster-binding protein [Marinobacterium jannaschii]
MAHQYAKIAYTDSVRQIQREMGSRQGYAGMDRGEDTNYLMGALEAAFIAARDSFYMASVSETGWPYLQHRGGPAGFMRVLDAQTLAFADFSGNRQYISSGNFRNNDRVALFFMDYPNRTRLKLLGRVSQIPHDDWEALAALEDDSYRAQVERGYRIRIEAFDWNCPQHIRPRYSAEQIDELLVPLQQELQQLKTGGAPGRHWPALIGEGELTLVVSGMRQLTPRIRAFELRHPDAEALPEVEAGAHLQIRLPLDSGEEVIRHYSICSNPARRDIYEIAVLHEPDGGGGSAALHRHLSLGQQLCCDLPQNHFPLQQDRSPVLLIAGGIGITPIKAMAQALDARGTELQLHYAGRSLREMAFADRLQRQLGERIRLWPSDQQRMPLAQILSAAPGNVRIYTCGPSRLIDAVVAEADRQGIDPQRVCFERFGAGPVDAATPVQLTLARSGLELAVPAEQSLLEAIVAAGVDLPHSCQAGNCRSCAVSILSGEALHRDSALTPDEREGQGLFCPCVSRAKGTHLTLDL